MKKGMGWPIGIAAILLATVASNIAVILITKDDPSFAVEPDYYRKAVEWDSTAARRARSDALSWQVAARVAPATGGATRLTLQLTDASGAVVHGAALAGSLLHIARAADVQAVTFAQAPSGAYEATVPMTRDGVWELRLTADRGDEHFVHTLRVETGLPASPLPAPEHGGP
jgi:nitrogen fixation protein FixH